jgi:hypothetical protein
MSNPDGNDYLSGLLSQDRSCGQEVKIISLGDGEERVCHEILQAQGQMVEGGLRWVCHIGCYREWRKHPGLLSPPSGYGVALRRRSLVFLCMRHRPRGTFAKKNSISRGDGAMISGEQMSDKGAVEVMLLAN